MALIFFSFLVINYCLKFQKNISEKKSIYFKNSRSHLILTKTSLFGLCVAKIEDSCYILNARHTAVTVFFNLHFILYFIFCIYFFILYLFFYFVCHNLNIGKVDFDFGEVDFDFVIGEVDFDTC